jgi:hypothetical protein
MTRAEYRRALEKVMLANRGVGALQLAGVIEKQAKQLDRAYRRLGAAGVTDFVWREAIKQAKAHGLEWPGWPPAGSEGGR